MILPEDTPGLKELLDRNAAKMANGEWPDSGPTVPPVVDLDDPEAFERYNAALAEMAKLADGAEQQPESE